MNKGKVKHKEKKGAVSVAYDTAPIFTMTQMTESLHQHKEKMDTVSVNGGKLIVLEQL